MKRTGSPITCHNVAATHRATTTGEIMNRELHGKSLNTTMYRVAMAQKASHVGGMVVGQPLFLCGGEGEGCRAGRGGGTDRPTDRPVGRLSNM